MIMNRLLLSLFAILMVGQASAQEKSAPPLNKIDTVGGVYFVTVQVAGGSFSMGSKEKDDQKPVHTVSLSSFYMGETEVTQAQWRAVMGKNPRELHNKGCDDCPVERVSWNDVQKFIAKLNAKTGKKYRLPTEAEWEYAARGGTKSKGYKFAGSNDLSAVAWSNENADGNTHPVKTKKPNELGLYDMSGNVFEWCNDWYIDTYYKTSPPENPECKKNATGTRVLRGGAWYVDPKYCQVAHRMKSAPKWSNFAYGFRLAMSTQ